ncbi:putative FmdB family regulatory protein [Rhizobium sp. BK275]|uniref:FmdB family zinc ribbon protein n=1 Tax=unclassified Rhizobium TaxID=2613769 RepID=UPI00161AD5EB|nr:MULTISPECIES: zinc ribbon domain-containing protein [unclassified Rhizobium]MBB3387946.1 putative FmdB family regulatory protein [Rhizobium sp. BK275]MBB3407295.1 putative FmdB family regulatory protein [Rhizobium sp. BK316]
MPYYDYSCDACGPFTELRPMARSAEPCDCPTCGTPAPRAFFTTPFFAKMEMSARVAHQTNEKAAHEPKTSKSLGHAPGCGCCSSKAKSKAVYRADGAKTFPSGRPWMISH